MSYLHRSLACVWSLYTPICLLASLFSIWHVCPLIFSGLPSIRSSPSVTIKNGTYVGVHSKEYNQDFFLGIPFAQPPVGDLRFRVPRSLNSSWTGTKLATSYSAACVGYGSDEIPYAAISEDCLYLNIIRPSGYEHSILPVAVWIHGGALTEGSGIDQRYNLSFTVAKSVKIRKPILGVTINYRLSMWGFITGDEIIDGGNANLGLRDQRLALHWIKENIGAYGGDPSKVTIWGESAGALSVGMHLTAYGGRQDHLFHGCILQSGNPVNYGSFDYNKLAFRDATTALGCNNAVDKLQCLREIPFLTLDSWINDFGSGLGWQPVIDGDFIQGKTSLQLANGQFVHVPVISGANSDEGTAFGPRPVDDEQGFLNILEEHLPAAAATAILHAYPPTITYGAVPTGMPPSASHPFGAHYRRSAAYAGDVTMIAHRRLTCETWARFGLTAYCYRFNALAYGSSELIGASHFQEVAFVFNNKDGVGYPPVSDSPFKNGPRTYYDLSDKMSEAWISFVHDGNPGNFWPVYGIDAGQNFVFDANATDQGYLELDSWRSQGINLINSWNSEIYCR